MQQSLDCMEQSLDFMEQGRGNVGKPARRRGSRLVGALRALTAREGMAWSQELEQDVATRWELHGDLVMLPPGCFTLHVWELLGGLDELACSLRAVCIARVLG